MESQSARTHSGGGFAGRGSCGVAMAQHFLESDGYGKEKEHVAFILVLIFFISGTRYFILSPPTGVEGREGGQNVNDENISARGMSEERHVVRRSHL